MLMNISVSNSCVDDEGFFRNENSVEPKFEDTSSSDFSIISKYIDVDNGNVYFEVSVGQRDSKNTNIFTREDLYNQSSKVINFGVPYFDKKPNWVRFVAEKEKNLPLKYCHKSLGFGKYNNKLIFKADTAIGIESTYFGLFDVKSKGSYED